MTGLTAAQRDDLRVLYTHAQTGSAEDRQALADEVVRLLPEVMAELLCQPPDVVRKREEIDGETVKVAFQRYEVQGTPKTDGVFDPPFGPPWCVVEVSRAEPEVNWPGDLIEQFEDFRDADRCRWRCVAAEIVREVK